MLTKLGMFVHKQQSYSLRDNSNFWDWVLAALRGDGASGIIPALERSICQSFIPVLADSDKFLRELSTDNTYKNPAYLYGKYKALGLFGIFYLGPIFLRKYHNDLIKKSDKSYAELFLVAIIYIPRIFSLFYELAVNFLLYFPIRIVNAVINRKPEYLTQEQHEKAQEKISAHFDKIEVPTAVLSKKSTTVKFFIKSFQKDKSSSTLDTSLLRKYIHNTVFIRDGMEGGSFGFSDSKDPYKESIAMACASGYLGEDVQEKAMKLYI